MFFWCRVEVFICCMNGNMNKVCFVGIVLFVCDGFNSLYYFLDVGFLFR